MSESVLTNMAALMGPSNGLAGTLKKPLLLFRVLSTFLPFIYRNRASTVMPKVHDFFTALRSAEALPIGVAGYCWGGKAAILLTHPSPASCNQLGARPLVDAAFTAHPSGLSIPNDIHPVRVPLAIAIGDKDMALSMKGVGTIQSVLEPKANKGECHQEVRIYPGAKHAFATRGNPHEEKEGEMADQAEEQALRWFTKYLVDEWGKNAINGAAPQV